MMAPMRVSPAIVAAVATGWLVLALPAPGSEPLADIYKYEDEDGVVHFTNIRPRGQNARAWQRVMRDPTGGGQARPRSPRESGEGCERCPIVPARDRSPERFARFDDYILEASALYRIPVPLIRAVIRIESDYDPRVVSSMGARGLMQLMPAVVSDMGISDPHDPRQNILAGTRLLRILANRYEGDLVRTVAAYHAGAGSLARYGDNVPPYPYTRQYVRLVLDRYGHYREQGGRHASR
jgi:hypothetical protein